MTNLTGAELSTSGSMLKGETNVTTLFAIMH
jgi:hypothetical protein